MRPGLGSSVSSYQIRSWRPQYIRPQIVRGGLLSDTDIHLIDDSFPAKKLLFLNIWVYRIIPSEPNCSEKFTLKARLKSVCKEMQKHVQTSMSSAFFFQFYLLQYLRLSF